MQKNQTKYHHCALYVQTRLLDWPQEVLFNKMQKQDKINTLCVRLGLSEWDPPCTGCILLHPTRFAQSHDNKTRNIKYKIKITYDMKSPGRAHIRYNPYTRFHCTFYCFPPRMIQIEKFFGQQSFMWRGNKQFQHTYIQNLSLHTCWSSGLNVDIFGSGFSSTKRTWI